MQAMRENLSNSGKQECPSKKLQCIS
uniref:Uncharacterized protein n=1 Tax=Oryza glumipatula TaxID=40148 RepID=A0A0E0APR2_9ORYZ